MTLPLAKLNGFLPAAILLFGDTGLETQGTENQIDPSIAGLWN